MPTSEDDDRQCMQWGCGEWRLRQPTWPHFALGLGVVGVLVCILNPQSRKDATTHGIFWQLCTYCALKLLDKKGTADETELCFALFLGPSIMDRERGKASSSSSSSLKNTIEWLQYLSVQPTKYIPRPMLENQNFNITVKLYLREPGKDYLIAPFDPFLNAHFMQWAPLFSTGSTYVCMYILRYCYRYIVLETIRRCCENPLRERSLIEDVCEPSSQSSFRTCLISIKKLWHLQTYSRL